MSNRSKNERMTPPPAVCRGVDLDPPYVDVVIQSYEGETGSAALLVDTVHRVDWLAARKAREATPD
jgi:hypothetical protein